MSLSAPINLSVACALCAQTVRLSAGATQQFLLCTLIAPRAGEVRRVLIFLYALAHLAWASGLFACAGCCAAMSVCRVALLSSLIESWQVRQYSYASGSNTVVLPVKLHPKFESKTVSAAKTLSNSTRQSQQHFDGPQNQVV